MSTSTSETDSPVAVEVATTDDTLSVELADGRCLLVPLAWYPRLQHATTAERGNWRLIGQGAGVHWPDLDEDISIRNLLDGRSSGESQQSLRRWLDQRSANPTTPA